MSNARSLCRSALLALVATTVLVLSLGRNAPAGVCKPYLTQCSTDVSCCSRHCVKPTTSHGSALFGECCTPTTCRTGIDCGTIPDGDCAGFTLNCGSCPTGKVCLANLCVTTTTTTTTTSTTTTTIVCPPNTTACDGECLCGCPSGVDCGYCKANFEPPVCPSGTTCELAIGTTAGVGCFAAECTAAIANQAICSDSPDVCCSCALTTENTPICQPTRNPGLCPVPNCPGADECTDSGQCPSGTYCVTGSGCTYNYCSPLCSSTTTTTATSSTTTTLGGS